MLQNEINPGEDWGVKIIFAQTRVDFLFFRGVLFGGGGHEPCEEYNCNNPNGPNMSQITTSKISFGANRKTGKFTLHFVLLPFSNGAGRPCHRQPEMKLLAHSATWAFLHNGQMKHPPHTLWILTVRLTRLCEIGLAGEKTNNNQPRFCKTIRA